MTTLTIQQNISLPKTHFKNLEELREFVVAEASYDREVRPEKLKQWAKASADIAKGKGTSFTSIKAMKAWLHNL